MVEPLLIELRRIGARADKLRDANETQALLVDLMLLRARLTAARAAAGAELNTVQRGIAAFNAYGQIARRP